MEVNSSRARATLTYTFHAVAMKRVEDVSTYEKFLVPGNASNQRRLLVADT